MPEPVAPVERIGRYFLRERIGQGSMGVVYRAVDETTGREVALKTLRFCEPDDLYRLKREFRVLSELVHPNLVRLYDLVVGEDHSFITMELVDGTDFLRYVRGAAVPQVPDNVADCDAQRLRLALRQLVAALEELHNRDKLHRDVKPGNVLVDGDGRVVLLDFDLVSGLQSRQSRDSQAGLLVGTLAYMAPEQLRGQALSPASDFYSVGVMLYESIAGRLPYDAAFDALHASEAPVLPVSTDGFPDDLCELTRALLSPRPEDRPTAAWIVNHLRQENTADEGARAVAREEADSRFEETFMGREVERKRLIELLLSSRDAAHTVLVEGVSGIGKSALIRDFCSRAEAEHGALVLEGRCHPHETVPFRAVDALVDDLARVMTRQAPEYLDAIMPRHAAALARVFPVLRRVPVFAAAALRGVPGAEPHEVLRRALDGFRELLSRLAEDRPVVFCVDDLQWGDLDSLDVLRALQRHPDAPRLLIVLSYRAEEREGSRVLQALFERMREDDPRCSSTLALGPLAPDDMRELAANLLAGSHRPDSVALVEAVVSGAGGSPFFAGELARHARTTSTLAQSAPDLKEVLLDRISRLPAEERRLLESIAVAGCPIDEEIAGKAASVSNLESALYRLRGETLLRIASTSDRRLVGCYHDRIREAVVESLGDQRRRQLHLSLARTLEAIPESDPQLLVDHYLLAEDRLQAAGHAYRSARKAAEALAFNRAASLFRQALDLGADESPRWQLYADLADTLVNGGYGAEAASAYLQAAGGLAESGGDRYEVLHLERLAAEQYLRSGFVDEGLDVMRRVLRELGLAYHDNPRTALASLIFNRLRFTFAARFGRRGDGRELTPDVQATMDALWSVGLGISDFDSVRAFDFQIRHALVAFKAGDPAHLSRAIATEAVILAMEGEPRKARRRLEAQVEGQRLAISSGDPQAQAHAMLMSAGVAFFDHRYRDALLQCDRGEQICRDQCVGVAWELANLQYLAAYSLAYLGELAHLQERLPEMLRRAVERGDKFAKNNYRIGLLLLAWLAPDRPEEAQRVMEDAMHERPPSKAPWQYHLGIYGAAHVDLYRNDPQAALERTERAWRILKSEQMMRLETVRVEHGVVHARALIACAGKESAANTAAKMLATAEREARRIQREPGRWAPAFAASLFAGIAAMRGENDSAARHLERAALGFDEIGMALHAASVRCQKARLGVCDAEEQDRVQAWMRQQGIVRADRIAAMIVPGFVEG